MLRGQNSPLPSPLLNTLWCIKDINNRTFPNDKLSSATDLIGKSDRKRHTVENDENQQSPRESTTSDRHTAKRIRLQNVPSSFTPQCSLSTTADAVTAADTAPVVNAIEPLPPPPPPPPPHTFERLVMQPESQVVHLLLHSFSYDQLNNCFVDRDPYQRSINVAFVKLLFEIARRKRFCRTIPSEYHRRVKRSIRLDVFTTEKCFAAQLEKYLTESCYASPLEHLANYDVDTFFVPSVGLPVSPPPPLPQIMDSQSVSDHVVLCNDSDRLQSEPPHFGSECQTHNHLVTSSAPLPARLPAHVAPLQSCYCWDGCEVLSMSDEVAQYVMAAAEQEFIWDPNDETMLEEARLMDISACTGSGRSVCAASAIVNDEVAFWNSDEEIVNARSALTPTDGISMSYNENGSTVVVGGGGNGSMAGDVHRSVSTTPISTDLGNSIMGLA